jgi:sugar/nucleoside kinase (ribokinase family)
MKNVLVLGGVSYNTIIYLEQFPLPRPQTVFSQGFHETVGPTGAGKALNLARLGFDVTLHGMIGEDEYGRKIHASFQNENITFLTDIDPAYDAAKIDTNGAGDAIFAGAIAGYANNLSVEKCLQWGTIAAGLCVTAPELAHPHLSQDLIRAAHRQHYQ